MNMHMFRLCLWAGVLWYAALHVALYESKSSTRPCVTCYHEEDAANELGLKYGAAWTQRGDVLPCRWRFLGALFQACCREKSCFNAACCSTNTQPVRGWLTRWSTRTLVIWLSYHFQSLPTSSTGRQDCGCTSDQSPNYTLSLKHRIIKAKT